MNNLPATKQVEIIAALCEGVGQRAVSRLTGTDRKTVARLALSIGRGAAELHDRIIAPIYPLVIAVHPRYRPDVPLVYMLACMTVAVTSISFVYTWLRIDSGSVWPAALLHAVSSNLQDFFEALTKDTGVTHYITYEFGAGFAIVLAIVAFVVWRRVTAASPGASP